MRKRRRRLATTELCSLDTQPEPDDGLDPETGPLRRCIIKRERLPKERMIRFVVGPDRQLVPDLAARLPGRGMWLSASGDVLHSASGDDTSLRNLARAFARAARGPVTLPPDLPATLQAALVRRMTEFLGLARRAGQAVAGYEKAREMLQAGRARLLVQAADGSPAEKLRIRSGLAAGVEIIDLLPGEALGRVFGRDYLVLIAVAPGKLAEALVLETGRLTGLRTGSERTKGSERTAERTNAPENNKAGTIG